MNEISADDAEYVVLVNAEEQYSIWKKTIPVPNGWQQCGKAGTKSECCEYVDIVWTDMRPLSLRKQMENVSKAERLE